MLSLYNENEFNSASTCSSKALMDKNIYFAKHNCTDIYGFDMFYILKGFFELALCWLVLQRQKDSGFGKGDGEDIGIKDIESNTKAFF